MSDLFSPVQNAFERFLLIATITLAAGSLLFISQIILASHRSEPPTPALRKIVEGPLMPVLGAEVGPGLDPADLQIALKGRAPGIDWDRAQRRIDTGPNLSIIDSLFVPVRTKAEAFAVCSALAGTTVSCTPVVATADELREIDGNLVGEDELIRRGVKPYIPAIQRWTKVVALTGAPGRA